MKPKKRIKKYIPQEIEPKWQAKWDQEKLYQFDIESAKQPQNQKREKYYTLVELPYPSGDLHIGHWFTFATPDVLSRYKRMQGYDVFFPMGYDAFGLPAENAAIKRHIHPKDWTMQNIKSMTKQFTLMGTMINWDSLTITCLPEYYKWNQWIFIEMYKKGIAYRSKTLSNWCPVDQTVLANEHVENGKCWRCGAAVEQKEVEQWFLKITDYADRLLWIDQKVNWPNSVRSAQNDWIGKKQGVIIHHRVQDMETTFDTFSAFPAWSFADTYIVIAPEHPLVKTLVKGTTHEKDVEKFLQETKHLTMQDRNEDKFEKKGVFTGRYAEDPFGGDPMPIWVANFALINFGTGIIRCSTHDPRDYEFAKKYGIPLKAVVESDSDMPVNAHANKGLLVNSGPFTGKRVESVINEMVNWIVKEGIGERFINYHLHDWSVSRQRYWGTPVPMIHCSGCGIVPVPEKDLPVELPYNVDYTPKGKPPLASNEAWLAVKCPKCGKDAKRDAETMDTFFDSSWYYYRYVNPEYDSGPFDPELVKGLLPLDIYFGGGEHTLGHTLYARFFTKFFHDLKLVDFDEFAKKRIQHGIVLGPDGNKMSKSKGNVINPDDVVKEYGSDAVRIYLNFMMPYEATGAWSTGAMYGMFRFLKRVWELYDRVIVDTSELSKEDLYWLHKTIKKVGNDIEDIKMNTALAAMMEWLNYVSKKDSVALEEYKALLLLLAPFAPHMTEELWEKLTIDPLRPPRLGEAGSEASQVSLNVKKKKNHQSRFNRDQSIHLQKWPVYEEKYLVTDEVMIVVQINGKLRDQLMIAAKDRGVKELIERKAKESEKIKKHLAGKEIKKVIYIPGKLLNFVV